MTKTAKSSSGAAPHLTVAAALLMIAGWTDLTEARRRDLASALSFLLRLVGRPAAAVWLDAVDTINLLDRASPKALGIQPSTFANRKANVRFILCRLGILSYTRVPAPKVADPAWAALLAALPPGPEFGRLRTFIAYCIAEAIRPEVVSNPVLETYAVRRAAERGGAKARDHARRVGVQWNLAAKKVSGWPTVRLGLRAKPLCYSPDFDAYPSPLQAEIQQYLSDIGAPVGKDIFAGVDRARRVKPATVITRKYCLRRLLHGGVQKGIPMEGLTSLSQVATPEFVVASLGWHYDRAQEANADLGQLASTIASIAIYLKVPDAEWAIIKSLLARAAPKPRTEINEKTAQLIDKLCEPECRARLIHLPERLMLEASCMRDGRRYRSKEIGSPQPEAAAWLAATAVAIEILLHAPMRLENLQHIRLGTELQLTRVNSNRWRGTIFLDGMFVKNKRRLEVPLQAETIALLRRYLDDYRPNLPAAESIWLFPGKGGPEKPRHKGAFGQAITESIEQYVGIRLNPHAFRALAGALILEADPHAIDDVRAMLGHSGFETAMIYYRRNSQREAANRLSATLARQRRATKLHATAQFLAPELRKRVRRS